ncbi:hypothetical protein Tsubulata_029126 [Turnera subulata]|uniref:Cyclin n=1 Tax=Turnera subulata TaxID=218843 RepID=A0A9Q0FAK0_9ROSI|nr:hypothetical protein Tsubulata_029126 [Turnera subulata]
MEGFQESQIVPNVITSLSTLLERVVEANDISSSQLSPHQKKLKKSSAFNGLTKPPISIKSYLERIFQYANCSHSCFVVAYVYLDRFSRRQPCFPINSFSVHRLLITSVLVSAKFLDDLYYNNAFYARVGGISLEEMNILEVDFLFGLGFHLNVTPTTFHTYYGYLGREMLMQSPLQVSNLGRSLKAHCCINEDESTYQEQLAA